MLERLSRAIDQASCFFMAIFLSGMVVIIFAQVTWRYMFESSIFWSEELCRYLMIWATMFGAGVCLRRGAHMGVRVVYDLFPAKIRQWTSIVVYVLILVFLSYAVWYGFSLVKRMWYQISPTLLLPMGMIYAAVPLGAVLMMLHTFALLQRICRMGSIDDPEEGKGAQWNR
jgi:TRAP-type C4-dicarboxylate transport system permease small subunit